MDVRSSLAPQQPQSSHRSHRSEPDLPTPPSTPRTATPSTVRHVSVLVVPHFYAQPHAPGVGVPIFGGGRLYGVGDQVVTEYERVDRTDLIPRYI